MLQYRETGDAAMLRHLVLVFAALALAGCATGYTSRDGYGDYYYGQPSVDYYDYGYGTPYGRIHSYPSYWRGGLGIGYGYGYGGYGYGYPPGYPGSTEDQREGKRRD